jgi:hypothetical protein
VDMGDPGDLRAGDALTAAYLGAEL